MYYQYAPEWSKMKHQRKGKNETPEARTLLYAYAKNAEYVLSRNDNMQNM